MAVAAFLSAARAQTTTTCSDNGLMGGFTCYSDSPQPRNNGVGVFDAFTRGAEEANQRANHSQQMQLQIQQMQQLQDMQRFQQQQLELQQYQQQKNYQQLLQQRNIDQANIEAQRARNQESRGPASLIHIENSIIGNRWTAYHIHQISKFKNDKLQGARFTLVFGDLIDWNYEKAIKQNYVVNCKKPSEVFLVLGSSPNGAPILSSNAFDFPATSSAGKSAIHACQRI